MAGVGPVPSARHTRGRNDLIREVVKSDGKRGGFDLEDQWLPLDKDGNHETWHPRTIAWWEGWRRSPQGVRMMTEPDWLYLLDTALLHHQMWQSGGRNSERAAEIRMRVAEFGSTPASRMRLRMDIEVPEEFPVGSRGSNRGFDPARRAALMAPTPGATRTVVNGVVTTLESRRPIDSPPF